MMFFACVIPALLSRYSELMTRPAKEAGRLVISTYCQPVVYFQVKWFRYVAKLMRGVLATKMVEIWLIMVALVYNGELIVNN